MKSLIIATILLTLFAFATPSRTTLETSSKRAQIDERQGGGLVDILKAFANLLKSIIGVFDGNSSVQDLVQSIQGIAFAIERVVNVQELISFIPFVGPYMASIVGGVATVLADSSMLTGLISQILIGPTY